MIAVPSDKDIKTMDELNSRLEIIRNDITINDAEVVRLKRLQESLTYTVGQLHNDKKDSEEKMAALTEAKKKLADELSGISSSITEAKKTLSEVLFQINSAKIKLEELKNGITQESSLVEQKANELSRKEEELKNREHELQLRENTISDRDSLSSAISEKVKEAHRKMTAIVQGL